MSYQSKGNVPIKKGMTDRIDSNIARDGAAKRPQNSFPIKLGMKDQTKELSGVSPANPGVGPDAAPANPLSPSSKLKKFGNVGVKWNQKDGNGNGLDGEIGGLVLSEASLLGK